MSKLTSAKRAICWPVEQILRSGPINSELSARRDVLTGLLYLNTARKDSVNTSVLLTLQDF